MSVARQTVAVLLGVAALIAGFAAHAGTRTAAEAQAEERVQQALERIEQLVAAADSGPGMAIGLTDRERLRGVVLHGYADLKAKTPVTADTRFAIGSISKSFTAVTLLQLADEGKFDPAAPISKYLPGFRVDSRYPPITGHSLLNHTSGLPNYYPNLSSMRYVVPALREFQPTYAPGEHFQYSNTGYQVLGYVVESIEGDAFPAVLKRRVLDRLGMHATLPQMDDSARQQMAVSYQRWPYDGSYVESNWFPYTAADGAIASTVGDMSAYVRFILNRGATPQGSLLSPAAFAKFTTPGLDDYAYGVSVTRPAQRTVVSHGGAIYGFRSYLEAHVDEGFGLIFLSNGRLDARVMGKVIGVASSAFGGSGEVALTREEDDQPMDAASYTGTYRRQDGASVVFSKAPDGTLLLARPDGTRVGLIKMGADIYGSSATGAYLFFAGQDHSGHVAQEVSNGADWYVKEGAAVERKLTLPADYRAYVGRYRNHSDEGPDVRVFARRGRLVMAPVESAAQAMELELVGPASFRPVSPSFSPERLVFDTVEDGVALRLRMSGVPLYRMDVP